ncbi:MAG: cell wall hydrolase [Oscillospiraceae bacterium]|nr:cell wall hydrolase [Oscillospiraceae bacterium]
MRKAKVVAIVCGMIASCLFGGFAVVEAATITLDDSSAVDVVETVEETTEDATESATTVTSIKTTAPATTSTTTIASDETPETTAATKETASVMTTAVKDETAVSTTAKQEPKTTAIAVRVSTQPAAAKATTSVQTTTVKTTTTTTTTTKVTTTKAVAVATTQAPAPVIEAVLTNPPMPVQSVTETITETIIDPVIPPVEFEIPPVVEEPIVVAPPADNSISESDYILLCNAVAHEAGANSISAVDKAKVVEVIMNRVYSPSYPNTIYEVLTQKYQFSGSSSYVDLSTYSSKVTDMVKESVDLYFADPSAFNEGYLSFTGDGVRNYFK